MRLRTSFAVAALAAALTLGPSAFAATASETLPLRPNLRGEVMILLYHRFGGHDARWTRAWSSFDKDLARLEADGFRPITLTQYVTADFALPAGTSPVVITFDDSTENQVKFTPEGKLAPDCALAHWVAFSQRHPDFPMRGVFFVNSGDGDSLTFEQRAFAAQKLRMIVSLGGEIGNHTWTHANLRKLSARAPAEIGRGEYEIERMLPGYQVHSFALPHGIYPVPQNLSWKGDWRNNGQAGPRDVKWDYEAVVKVGANPAPSPLVAGFSGLHLPRIQAFDPELDKWLTYFERHPEHRFISDGQRHAPGSLAAGHPAKPRTAL